MKSRFILFSILILILSACAAPDTPQAVETERPTDAIPTPAATLPLETAEPSPTSETVPAIEMTTYTDGVAGFALDYPAGWYIDDSAAANANEAFAYTVGIATWDLRNPPTPDGKKENNIPEGGTKIDVTVVKDSMTLEQAVAQQSQNETASPILAQQSVTLANGVPAVILDVEGFAGLTRTLITVLNGNVIYVSGFGDLEHFEAIALSLRAI